MSGVVWVTIFLNLTTLPTYGPLWEYVRQTYGLMQRMLFGAWFGWSAGLGVLLFNLGVRSQILGRRNCAVHSSSALFWVGQKCHQR